MDYLEDEHSFLFDTRMNQRYQDTITSTNIRQNVTNNSNANNYSFSHQDTMDIVPFTTDTVESIYKQTNENIDTVS